MLKLPKYNLPFRRNLAAGRSWAISTLLALAAIANSGCAAERQQSIVRLEISTHGVYVVDGSTVEKTALAIALSSKRRPGSELLVHVIPQTGANYEAVQSAMEAAQKAGAKIGMVGNERF